MREILFRGRDKEGYWVEGNLVHLQCVTRGTEVTKETWKIHPVRINLESPVVVDPETVGQWTGLRDISGERIYEGDVVKRYLNDVSVPGLWRIEYDPYGVGGWANIATDDAACEYGNDALDGVTANCCVVVTNIYDNPELVNGGEGNDPV